MKNTDIRGILTGVILSSIIFLTGGAASNSTITGWDEKQEWLIASRDNLQKASLIKGVTSKQANGKMLYHFKAASGWEPFGANDLYFRKRIK